MAYTTIHTKANGTKYLYSVEGYWDAEKKQGRNRQTCLGRIDDETGEVIPSGRKDRAAKRAASAPEVTARSRIIGPYLLLDKISNDTGLAATLKRCFPGRHEHILSLAFFLVQKGAALSRCEPWSLANAHPFGGGIPSQRVSDLLAAMEEGEFQSFFKKWMGKTTDNSYFFYDITSVSSYSEQNEYVKWGHNRDGEKLPQINLGMLYGQTSGLPGYYRRLPGSISDVSTLGNTIASLGFAGHNKLSFVMDRGFYSEANIDALFGARMGFVIALPHRAWVDAIYERYREEVFSPWRRAETGENETLYMMTVLHKWKGRRCYVHIYYNNFAAAADADAFDLKLTRWRAELMSGNASPGNEKYYEKYFTVRDLPKRGRKVEENSEAVSAARNKYSGFFSIMTAKKMDAAAALQVYRRKEFVENCFDDLKNTLDMKRLRVHSSKAMDSRLFIQFVALILLSRMRSIARQSESLKNMGARDIMEALESVVEVKYSGRYGRIVTEVDPLQRNIMEVFGVTLES
jgi:hypothetical protein